MTRARNGRRRRRRKEKRLLQETIPMEMFPTATLSMTGSLTMMRTLAVNQSTWMGLILLAMNFPSENERRRRTWSRAVGRRKGVNSYNH